MELPRIVHTERWANAVGQASERPRAELSVLLAEGGAFNQRLGVRLLEKLGHRPIVVEHSDDAVARFRQTPCDLLLLDTHLPGEEVHKVVGAIRAQEHNTGDHVPIIVLSCDGDCNSSHIAAQLAEGIDGILQRPLRSGDLSDLIDKHCTADFAGEVNWREAVELVEGREELLGELVEIFLSEYGLLLEQVETAITQSDAKNLRVYAHGLKGCLRYFGRTTAVEVAASLEKRGEAAELDGAPAAFADLRSAIERLVPELKAFLAKRA